MKPDQEKFVSRISLKHRAILVLEQAMQAPSGEDIFRTCIEIAELLIYKNTAYGDAALTPVRIFSKADATEQIRVRIDDKLNLLMQGQADLEDVPGDLLGYLVLLRIAERRARLERQSAQIEAVFLEPAFEGVPARPLRSEGFSLDAAEKTVEIRVVTCINACQECGNPVEADLAVCDVCYEQRFKCERRRDTPAGPSAIAEVGI